MSYKIAIIFGIIVYRRHITDMTFKEFYGKNIVNIITNKKDDFFEDIFSYNIGSYSKKRRPILEFEYAINFKRSLSQ